MQKPLIIIVIALTFAAGLALGLANRPAPATLQAATHLMPARDIAPFSLRTANEAVLDNAALEGNWTLVFFGFTNCPDICPTTLQLLSDARDSLTDAEPATALPDILLISVDPERDTPQALADYAAYFGDAVYGATGDDAAIASIAADLGIVYVKVPLDDEGAYTMDHSGTVLLIDPDVRLRAVFTPPLSAASIAYDLGIIIGNAT